MTLTELTKQRIVLETINEYLDYPDGQMAAKYYTIEQLEKLKTEANNQEGVVK